MATPSSDEEQIEQLLRLWHSHGKFIVGGIAIGLVAIFGYQMWQNRITDRSETASLLYANMMTELANNPTSKTAVTEGQAIVDTYDDTPYAAFATLALANRAYLAGEMDGAENSLKWALDNAPDKGIEHIARLRLARLYLEQNRLDDIEALINGIKFEAFEASYRELQGDIFRIKKNDSEARNAYSAALSLLSPQAGELRELIQAKLNNLGSPE